MKSREEVIRAFRVVSSKKGIKLVGRSQKFLNLLYEAGVFAGSKGTNIFLYGETGVGKDLLALAIHHNSPETKMLEVHCGDIPKDLFQSIMFGRSKGAFTSSSTNRKGFLENALGKTLFLNEISTIPFECQSALLGVLDGKEFYPVGSDKPLRPNFRIISASNQNLEAGIKAGTFRKDLYYRLKGCEIHLPPLHEREEDIPLLAIFFARQIDSDIEFSDDAIELLLRDRWSGNVRQLKHVVENASIFAMTGGEERIDCVHLKGVGTRQIRQSRTEKQDISTSARDIGTEVFDERILVELISDWILKEIGEEDSSFDTIWNRLGVEVIDAVEKKFGTKTAAAIAMRISRTTVYERKRKLREGEKTKIISAS